MNILAHDHIIGWLSTSGRDKDESLYAFCIITSKCFVYKIHHEHCNQTQKLTLVYTLLLILRENISCFRIAYHQHVNS